VPRAGEAFFLDGFRFVVERVVRRRIMRVFLERLHIGRGVTALASKVREG
jgi:hypothetical protein